MSEGAQGSISGKGEGGGREGEGEICWRIYCRILGILALAGNHKDALCKDIRPATADYVGLLK